MLYVLPSPKYGADEDAKWNGTSGNGKDPPSTVEWTVTDCGYKYVIQICFTWFVRPVSRLGGPSSVDTRNRGGSHEKHRSKVKVKSSRNFPQLHVVCSHGEKGHPTQSEFPACNIAVTEAGHVQARSQTQRF